MPRRASVLTAILTSAATGLGLVALANGTAHAAAPSPIVHTANAIQGLGTAQDLGALPDSRKLSLAIALNRPDQAGETAYIKQVEDPSSPLFRHFLTPAQFAAEFGVPAATRSAVQSYLAAGGLTVDGVSAAGDLFNVSGSVHDIDALFGIGLHDYRLEGNTFFANTVAPSVPADLSIANISGLNSLQRFSLPSTGPAQDTCVGSTCLGNTTPQDLWKVYDTGDHTGAGQGVAMFGEGQSDGVISDLRQFESENNLPQVPVNVEHPAGDTDFSDDSGSEEWDIDTQASTGMAPDAKSLTMYFGSDLSDADVEKLFSQYVNDPTGPQQASASFGECEQLPAGLSLPSTPVLGLAGTSTDDAELTAIEQQGVLEGKSIFVSTGDTGSSCPVVYAPEIGAGNGVLNQAVPITNSPASLPWSVAVGGTVLYTDGQGNRSREYGWAFGGGGDTLFTDRPDYQAGDANDDLPCLTDGQPCRGIPDISAQSGDVLTNGYGIVAAGVDSPGGGTSLSAPLAQGLWADVQSSAPTASGYGFANYVYYSAGESADYAKDFFDVSSEDTSTGLPAANGLYTTGPGWDYVTGWGTQEVDGLATYAAGMATATQPSSSTTPSPSGSSSPSDSTSPSISATPSTSTPPSDSTSPSTTITPSTSTPPSDSTSPSGIASPSGSALPGQDPSQSTTPASGTSGRTSTPNVRLSVLGVSHRGTRYTFRLRVSSTARSVMHTGLELRVGGRRILTRTLRRIPARGSRRIVVSRRLDLRPGRRYLLVARINQSRSLMESTYRDDVARRTFRA